jgi:hypothetical protein
MTFAAYEAKFSQMGDIPGEAKTWFEVEMVKIRDLVSDTPLAALSEAKALGIKNPMIGEANG